MPVAAQFNGIVSEGPKPVWGMPLRTAALRIQHSSLSQGLNRLARAGACVHFTLLLESAPRSYSITKPSASIR